MIPERIYINQGAADFPLGKKFLKTFSKAKIITMAQGEAAPSFTSSRKDFIKGKKSLFLTEQKGALVRKLTRPYGHHLPEYYLYHAVGCPYDCQYCFLQQWLQKPLPTIFVNRENFFEQIEAVLKMRDGGIYLHAGEMADALIWDRVSSFSETLARCCHRFPEMFCELRTKSAEVEKLLTISPVKNMIISWSLSPAEAISRFEPKTPSLEKRLEAIRRVAQAGFQVALRFDPVICVEDFEKDYSFLIKKIAQALPGIPQSISAGSLRMSTPCLTFAKKRFPKSRLFAGELVFCSDRKWRYCRPLRKKAYKIISSMAKDVWNMDVSLCMEPD